MSARRSKDSVRIGTPAPPWMVSYGDLVTQLLVFFVMMFALAAATTEQQLREIKRKVENYTVENKIEDYVFSDINDKGLVVSLSDKLMFESGKADLASDEARTHIRGISSILLEYPNYVKIEGHTDNVPISTKQFPSNWELSTTRATTITRYLIEDINFPADRLSSAGYSEFHPIMSNQSVAGRARNRRVDLIIARLSLEQQRVIREQEGLVGKEFEQ